MEIHNKNLDLLRIMAAFFVMFCHIGQYCGFQITSQMGMATKLFFILSGFLIFQSIENTNSISQYYIKRFIRIVPIYWVTLCINYIVQLLWSMLIEGASFAEVISTGPCSVRYARYFTLLHMVVPTDNYQYWNNAYAVWTISSFAIFYIIAPLLFRLIDNFWKAMAVMGVSLCITPITTKGIYKVCILFLPETTEIKWFATGTPINTIYCFLIGIAVYFALKERRQFEMAVFLSLVFVCGRANWYTYEMIWGLLILAAVTCPAQIRFGESIVKVMSNFSFSLYLIHPAILKVANYGVNNVGGGINKCIVLTICAVSGGLLYWRWIEVPINKKFSHLLKTHKKVVKRKQ